jgi:hypothetical protein
MKTGNTIKVQSLMIIFLIIGNQFSSAQNELFTETKLIVPGKQWVFLFASGEPPWEVTRQMCYEIGNDTIIAKENYKELVLTNNCTLPQEIRGFIRETDNGKVYFLNNYIHPEEEFLLYDFGMQVGDTTFYVYEQFPYYYALDSTGTNEDGRKLFHITNSFKQSEIWIEGVGAKIGLLKEVMTGESQIFTCCILGDELLYHNPGYGSCYFKENDSLTADAGNDIIVCPLAEEEIVLGGNPSASGGLRPYTYTWSGKHFDLKYPEGIPSWIYASNILDDTTKSNPVITELRNVPEEWTTYYLEVEDAEGTIMYDSVRIIKSLFLVGGPYKLPVTVHKGDSVQFFGNISLFSNFEPLTEYRFSPAHGLSDSTDIYGWAMPDTSITYYLEAVNSAGCRSEKIAYWHIEVIDTTTVSNAIFKNQMDIEVFPNPARDKITIYSQNSTILAVEMYDLTGTCIYRNLNAGSNRVELETHNLPKGMYVLKIRDEGNTISRRIVIQ